MPQSASPVGLARTLFPQNNSTSVCSIYNTVVLELKGSSKKKPEMKTVRSWFVRAESIRKLDRAEKATEDAGVDDVPF
jgi:hypothetical protein